MKSIADKLHLSEDIVRKSVGWMMEQGFLKRESNQIAPTSQRIHLSGDSPFIDQHHRNWRNEALRSLNRKTGVRELLLQAIAGIETILKPSKDEELVGIGLDLFKY